MKTIYISWEGPFTYDNIIRKFNRDDDTYCDYGLYQIYGPHELYSNKKRPKTKNILLYIGMTVSGSSFSGRIAKHGFCHALKYEIYLGRIEGQKYDDDVKTWKHDVCDAEKLLINKYTPPYNAKGTGDLTMNQLHCRECIILNYGKRIDLNKKVSSKDIVYKIG